MRISPKSLNVDIGLLILRLSTGFLMLFHGVSKLVNGHGFIRDMLSEKGLPDFLWLGVPLTEVVSPILLVLGIFTRFSGLGVALVMVFSILLAHPTDAFTLTQWGGLTSELSLLFMFGGLTLFFTGGGKYSLYKPSNELLR